MSARSFSVRAGAPTRTPGRLIPFWELRTPTLKARAETQDGSSSTPPSPRTRSGHRRGGCESRAPPPRTTPGRWWESAGRADSAQGDPYPRGRTSRSLQARFRDGRREISDPDLGAPEVADDGDGASDIPRRLRDLPDDLARTRSRQVREVEADRVRAGFDQRVQHVPVPRSGADRADDLRSSEPCAHPRPRSGGRPRSYPGSRATSERLGRWATIHSCMFCSWPSGSPSRDFTCKPGMIQAAARRRK